MARRRNTTESDRSPRLRESVAVAAGSVVRLADAVHDRGLDIQFVSFRPPTVRLKVAGDKDAGNALGPIVTRLKEWLKEATGLDDAEVMS